ncbi:MAG TPA: hypothetical protein PLN91_14970 [Rhodanobacteraceae bacterium]|nr:hypothetical protein [Rhodanobacteraceae bacterium]
MRKSWMGTLGLLLALAAPAWAADALDAAQAGARSLRVAEQNAALTRLDRREGGSRAAAVQRSGTAALTAAATASEPSPPFANSYRAYPPSCLADPLPFDTPTEAPRYAKTVRLASYRPSDGTYGVEDVTITLWRVPCSSSGQFYNSATLLAIDRVASQEGKTPYPLFPGVALTQGNNTLKLVRVASEPNTVLSHTNVDSPLLVSQVFVLENFASTDSTTAYFDFNLPFTITFYNYFAGDTGQSISVPTYSPTQATFPNAFRNVPISGYLSGNWSDPAKGGEGMTVQVLELPGNTTQYLFTFAWFTYDPSGLPYWLFGGATVPAGTRGPITVDTVYSPGGSFVGGASVGTLPKWGTVSFSFPDCGRMNFTATKSTTAAGTPGSTGVGVSRQWSRFIGTDPLSMNGISCE